MLEWVRTATLLIDELTTVGIRDQICDGWDTVIVPEGAENEKVL